MLDSSLIPLGRPLLLGPFALLFLCAGCFSPWMSESDQATRRDAIKKTLESENRPRIVSQIAYDRMLTLTRIENIGLVSRLPGTGGKVNASQPREKILDNMRRYDVAKPNSLLDDPSTAMVVAFVTVPPAASKGQQLDVQVTRSTHAEATSLARGWLLETSLVEMSKLGGQVREGFELAVAEGAVVTAAEITGSKDPADATRGIVIGGARLKKGRDLGIGIESDLADAITMAAILPAINRRFTKFDGRKQTGIATPLDDNSVQLDVPVRYKLDPFHFINVVLQVSFNESDSQRANRLETLKMQLKEPTTVRNACWQLEALGESSIPLLVAELQNPNREIRFYVAHSLAYLGDRRAIEPLKDLCRQEPSFRAMCLNGLSIIDNYEAEDALEELLHAADAETRFGAVRALRHRNATDPMIVGEQVGEVGSLLEIPSSGPPLVAISLSTTPEIVMFGNNPQLHMPAFHYVTKQLMINAKGPGTVLITHFEAGREDRVLETGSDLRSILSGIAEVDGTYGNWVSFIRESSENGYLTEPIAINPIPLAGRKFDREEEPLMEPGERAFDQTIINSDVEAEKKSDRAWYNPLTWWE